MLPALRAIKFFDHATWLGRRTLVGHVPDRRLYDSRRRTKLERLSSAATKAERKPSKARQPATTLTGASWLAGDFSDPLTGVLAGRTSALATVRRHGIEPARTADFGLRMLHRVRLVERDRRLVGGRRRTGAAHARPGPHLAVAGRASCPAERPNILIFRPWPCGRRPTAASGVGLPVRPARGFSLPAMAAAPGRPARRARRCRFAT